MVRLLLIAMVFLAGAARANVAPSPPDPCYDLNEGAACKPRTGPPGKCKWASHEQLSLMQIVDEARKDRREGQWRALVCVSGMFEGDAAARNRKAAELIDKGDLDGAFDLLRYNMWSVEKCDAQIGRLWHRFARAAEKAGRTRPAVKGYDRFAAECGFRE